MGFLLFSSGIRKLYCGVLSLLAAISYLNTLLDSLQINQERTFVGVR